MFGNSGILPDSTLPRWLVGIAIRRKPKNKGTSMEAKSEKLTFWQKLGYGVGRDAD
jgi:hypothetical protein